MGRGTKVDDDDDDANDNYYIPECSCNLNCSSYNRAMEKKWPALLDICFLTGFQRKSPTISNL